MALLKSENIVSRGDYAENGGSMARNERNAMLIKKKNGFERLMFQVISLVAATLHAVKRKGSRERRNKTASTVLVLKASAIISCVLQNSHNTV